MSITYTPQTTFAAKDNLPSSDPDKVLSGVPFDIEYTAIQAAFTQAAPTASPVFSGTATFENLSASGTVTLPGVAINGNVSGTHNFTGTVTVNGESLSDTAIIGWNTTKATVDTKAAGWDATKTTVDAGAANWNTAYSWGDHASAGYTTTDTTYSAGAGLGLTGTVFSHADTSAAASVNNSGNTFIQDLTFDTYGHVTGYTSAAAAFSGGSNITLSGTTFNLDSSLTGLVDVDTSTVSIGSWEIKLDGSDLRFVYGGVDKLRLTTAGQVIAGGDVTAFGAP